MLFQKKDYRCLWVIGLYYRIGRALSQYTIILLFMITYNQVVEADGSAYSLFYKDFLLASTC